jgi:hypothetical protein
MRKARVFPLATREVFGPLQVVTEYRLQELDSVLEVCERMHAHLTAAVVSRDEQFRCVWGPLGVGDAEVGAVNAADAASGNHAGRAAAHARWCLLLCCCCCDCLGRLSARTHASVSVCRYFASVLYR